MQILQTWWETILGSSQHFEQKCKTWLECPFKISVHIEHEEDVQLCNRTKSNFRMSEKTSVSWKTQQRPKFILVECKTFKHTKYKHNFAF